MLIQPHQNADHDSKKKARHFCQRFHCVGRAVRLVVLAHGSYEFFNFIVNLINRRLPLPVNVYNRKCFIGIILETLFNNKGDTQCLALVNPMSRNKAIQPWAQGYGFCNSSAEHMKQSVPGCGI